MGRTFRFYLPPESLRPGIVALSEEEAHHAIHVARLQPHDSIEVFDGCGGVGRGQIQTIGRREVIALIDQVERMASRRRALTLAVAFPNREKALERIVESCVPLGVSHFVIFESERSARKPALNPKWDRWSREACKQSYQAWMPKYSVADSLAGALQLCEGATLISLDPESAVTELPASLAASERCACLVGPEGGLSEREYSLARDRGAVDLSLGPAILRTELACAAISALVAYRWRTTIAPVDSIPLL